MADPAQKPSGAEPAPSGRALLWVAAALVLAAAAAIVLLLLPGTRDKATAHPSAELSPPGRETVPSMTGGGPEAERPPNVARPATSPPAGAAPPLPTVDLFTGEAPELMSRGREVTNRGDPLSSTRLKEVYQFGKDHPGDARPYLLMGADSMNRQWYGFAVDHYRRAQKEDPRARQDPRMLRDLVQIAGDRTYASQAGDAIRDIYGPSAITAVEDAIAEAGSKGDLGRVERLTAAGQALSGLPAPH